jgi:serine protease DegS
MLGRMREQKNLRVGVAPSAPAYVYNVATGLIVDNAGHIVTRLANLDLQDKDQKISVTTSTGARMPARLIGVDCATGFAVLEVASLSGGSQSVAAPVLVSDGMAVNIVSSDVVQRASSQGGNSIFLSPALKLVQGNVLTKSPYAKARGALTLLSNSLMARNDSSVVQTLDNLVIGIAQWAGFGRAYVFPIELVRDTIARRVIERKDNVPAGWLGATGVSIAQLPEGELNTLGLKRQTGVIVREVLPGGPAAASGILPNDVIVGLDDWDVTGAPDLKAMLSWSPAGRKITLRAIRNRQPLNLDVVLGARPDSTLTMSGWVVDEAADPLLSQREEVEKRLAGLQSQYKIHLKSEHSRERDEALRELEIEMRQLMDIERALLAAGAELERARRTQSADYTRGNVTSDEPSSDVSFKVGFTGRELTPQLAAARFQTRGGILVSGVLKESAADRAGIRVGDVIVSSRDRMIMSVAQLQALLSTQPAEISLKIMRDGQPTVVTLNIH